MSDTKRAVATSEYDGSCGYWYNDNWHRTADEAIEAFWEECGGPVGKPALSAMLDELRSDTFRRGTRVRLDSKGFAERVADDLHENLYDGCVDFDPDPPPYKGGPFGSLVAAIEVYQQSLNPVYLMSSPIDMTAEIKAWYRVGIQTGSLPVEPTE